MGSTFQEFQERTRGKNSRTAEFLKAQKIFGVAGYEELGLSGHCHGKKVVVGGVWGDVNPWEFVQYKCSVQPVDEHAEFSWRHQPLEFRVTACASQFEELSF